MDMSPLPHKQPSCAQVEVLSPTEISPHDDSMDADSVFTEPIATSRASSLGPSLAPSPALEPARPSFLE